MEHDILNERYLEIEPPMNVLEDHLLNALSGMTAGPAPLFDAIRFYAQQPHKGSNSLERDLQRHITAGPNNEVRKLLNQHLGRWTGKPTLLGQEQRRQIPNAGAIEYMNFCALRTHCRVLSISTSLHTRVRRR